MRDRPTRWYSRVLGGMIGAGGTYAIMQVSGWGLSQPLIIGATVAMGLAGLAFGPRIVEVLIDLF